jgi:hypothetical protein
VSFLLKSQKSKLSNVTPKRLQLLVATVRFLNSSRILRTYFAIVSLSLLEDRDDMKIEEIGSDGTGQQLEIKQNSASQSAVHPITALISSVASFVFQTIGTLFHATNSYERKDGFWTTKADETKTGIFTELVPRSSQRENWYSVTPYIAEFWNTVSNVAFIAVGILQGSPELVVAGCASALSHAIPKKWLLTVDKISVGLVLTRVVRERELFFENPWLALPLALAGVINVADTYISRRTTSCAPHVFWHVSSAFLANVVLQSINAKKLT